MFAVARAAAGPAIALAVTKVATAAYSFAFCICEFRRSVFGWHSAFELLQL